jgi:hypothetical protein
MIVFLQNLVDFGAGNIALVVHLEDIGKTGRNTVTSGFRI